jgi:hypothetical protein
MWCRRSAGTALAIAIALALPVAVTAVSLPACGGGAAARAPDDRAVLEVTCPVADAVLWVDGRYLAQLRDLRGGVTLAPGRHQIELHHDRHHAYYGEIELRRGERRRIAISLAEALP